MPTTYTIREATWTDLGKIAKNLHRADREVLAAQHVSPFDSMKYGMEMSRPCHVGLADGEPIAIFGAIPLSDPEAYLKVAAVWFMATDDAFSKHGRAILRRSSAWVQMLDYDRLLNTSRSDIPELTFWMGWLGFETVQHDTRGGFPMTLYKREAVPNV